MNDSPRRSSRSWRSRARAERWALGAGALLVGGVLTPPALGAERVLHLEDRVDSGGPRHFTVPFEVPAGTVELEVRHRSVGEGDILDWGLEDQAGFRGWGGGNTEPAVVGLRAASRSYVPGPIQPGTWKLVVGKAKLVSAAPGYSVDIVLRDAATLPEQPERRPYGPVEPLRREPRWYAGDLHVHSRESGDARPSLEEIAQFARGRGLDFVMLADHNTLTQLDFIGAAQAAHPEVLLVPGMEWTSYAGHANAIGLTRWVDARVGQPGVTAESAAQAIREAGALLSINHPTLELGEACIGCAWKQPLEPSWVGAVEVGTGAWTKSGFLFTPSALAFWEGLAALGHHVVPVGGSDDHRAGVELSGTQSPIGSPTTLVYAPELSVAGLLQGLRAGRTVVKLEGPEDPMLELSALQGIEGDRVRADAPVTLVLTVSGLRALTDVTVVIVEDGVEREEQAVTSDPCELTAVVSPPASGQRRVRAELRVDGKPRTLTSHLWIERGRPPGGPDPKWSESSGCACTLPRSTPARSRAGLVGAVGALGLLAGRRRGPRERG